ncbi:F0F1 ATP synthase subunit gamma [Brevibacterium aurantiacum]|uniref:F0F1 ATP synthase subunit gamma n=1 Tax=Brevibacterium aurantiacum TaxID=273384 RepID=UPI003F901F48
MGAQQRVFKQKIRSTSSLRKIFKAMELIAASRIQKAIARSQAASPYANALTRAVSAVASESNVDHVLTSEPENVSRAAVLIVGPDRGFAGAYSANLLREAEELIRLLHSEGKDVSLFTVGGKAENYYTFRDRAIDQAWTGISEMPTPENARKIGGALLQSFNAESAEGGVDEIYIVFTKFVSSVKHDPEYRRLLPLEVVDAEEVTTGASSGSAKDAAAFPLYEFEPSAEAVLDSLLPRYIDSRILSALLSASASEQASRQAAMHTATENADDLIKTYTRLANTARQAEITQELTEIVGGADALAASSAGD